MNRQEVFEVWAPSSAVWSRWAKPVAFAHMDDPDMDGQILDWKWVKANWAPTPEERTAVILDLAEGSSLSVGMALAVRGFRPVPLYNGCPGTFAVIDMRPILRGLEAYTDDLMRMNIRPDAPPVFLLDSGRMPTRKAPPPGRFDNRWVVLPQDFPSATFLKSHGIQRVLIVNDNRIDPADDLAHVLVRWQEAGITIMAKSLANDAKPQPLNVHRPSHYRMWWYRFLAMTGLRRNAAGGFGAMVPYPTESSGWSGRGFG